MRVLPPGEERWLARETKTLCVGGPVLLVPVCGDVRAPCLEPFATFDLHARDYLEIALQPGWRGEARDRAWAFLAQELGVPEEHAGRLSRQHVEEGRLEALFLVGGRWRGSHETPVGHSEAEPLPLAFDLRRALVELAEAGRALHVPGFDDLAASVREAMEFPAGPLGPPLRPPRIVRVEEVSRPAPPPRREARIRPGVRVEEVVLPRRPRREEPPDSPGVRVERMPGVRARPPAPEAPAREAPQERPLAAPPVATPSPPVARTPAPGEHVVDGGTCVRCGRRGAELAGACPGPQHGRMGMIELD